MKFTIASDIHGSEYYCKKLIEAFHREQAERMIILGDILYHGPRNGLPRDYNPKSVIAMMNELSSKLICVRGNCDTEVDQMVLDFPIMADYGILPVENKIIYATHGHVFGEDNPPPLKSGDILLCGHTHVPKIADKGDYVYLNPGSVSIPKENSEHSYMILEDGQFTWKNLEGSEYMSYSIK